MSRAWARACAVRLGLQVAPSAMQQLEAMARGGRARRKAVVPPPPPPPRAGFSSAAGDGQAGSGRQPGSSGRLEDFGGSQGDPAGAGDGGEVHLPGSPYGGGADPYEHVSGGTTGEQLPYADAWEQYGLGGRAVAQGGLPVQPAAGEDAHVAFGAQQAIVDQRRGALDPYESQQAAQTMQGQTQHDSTAPPPPPPPPPPAAPLHPDLGGAESGQLPYGDSYGEEPIKDLAGSGDPAARAAGQGIDEPDPWELAAASAGGADPWRMLEGDLDPWEAAAAAAVQEPDPWDVAYVPEGGGMDPWEAATGPKQEPDPWEAAAAAGVDPWEAAAAGGAGGAAGGSAGPGLGAEEALEKDEEQGGRAAAAAGGSAGGSGGAGDQAWGDGQGQVGPAGTQHVARARKEPAPVRPAA
jgi:hypothetical protein